MLGQLQNLDSDHLMSGLKSKITQATACPDPDASVAVREKLDRVEYPGEITVRIAARPRDEQVDAHSIRG